MPKIPMPLSHYVPARSYRAHNSCFEIPLEREMESERATEEEEGNECSNESHKRAAEITMQGALAFS